MSTTPTVLGNMPLEYTDPVTGKQVSIPLSALKFTNGQLGVDPLKWPAPPNPLSPNPPYITLPGFINAILKNLSQQGLIIPVPVPSPKPAMVVTATDPGSAGNNIVLTFAITTPNLDPTQVQFSMTITETDTYTGLTPASIITILGTDKTAGTRPGLVHVVQSTLPANGLPGAVSQQPFTQPAAPPPPPPPGPNAQSVLMNNAKSPVPFVTLEAKKSGPGGALTTVTIANVTATAFDLTASWTNTVTGLTLANVQSNTKTPLCYDVMVSPPASGIFSIPQATNTVQLSGGTDGASPAAASAIVFAGQ